MAGQINKILTNLKAAIERVAQEEGNKNGKIDTMGEKNKIAELLAGAKQEVGDFLEKELDKINNKKLTKAQYDKQAGDMHKLGRSAQDKIDDVKKKMDIMTKELQFDEEKLHKFKDGNYDAVLEEFDDGSYSTLVYNKDKKVVGKKLYKNDNEVYSNRDYVAKKLGLFKDNFGRRIGAVLWDMVPFSSHHNYESLTNLKEGEYLDDNLYVYHWNEKDKTFEIVRYEGGRQQDCMWYERITARKSKLACYNTKSEKGALEDSIDKLENSIDKLDK